MPAWRGISLCEVQTVSTDGPATAASTMRVRMERRSFLQSVLAWVPLASLVPGLVKTQAADPVSQKRLEVFGNKNCHWDEGVLSNGRDFQWNISRYIDANAKTIITLRYWGDRDPRLVPFAGHAGSR